jgi:hypothetical protein
MTVRMFESVTGNESHLVIESEGVDCATGEWRLCGG